jgi:hypothetical protein
MTAKEFKKLDDMCERIYDIQDPLIREIFTWHFIERYSWVRTAFKIGNNTEDSVKKIAYRYLEKHPPLIKQ